MTDIYAFRIDVFTAEPVDLTGFDVEATDGRIGTVDEASLHDGDNCLVVDTGFWIFGKKRLVPAGIVSRVDVDARKVFVSMTKDQIKAAPDLDQERHAAGAHDHHVEHAEYYRPFGPIR